MSRWADSLSGLDRLGLEHLGEGALALPRNEPVLLHHAPFCCRRGFRRRAATAAALLSPAGWMLRGRKPGPARSRSHRGSWLSTHPAWAQILTKQKPFRVVGSAALRSHGAWRRQNSHRRGLRRILTHDLSFILATRWSSEVGLRSQSRHRMEWNL